MKAGDDQERVAVDQKKQRVGKYFYTRSPKVFEHLRKLQRGNGHPLHGAVEFRSKAAAEAWRFPLVPILRLNEFSLCGRREADRPHLRGTVFEFGFEGVPANALRAVFVEPR